MVRTFGVPPKDLDTHRANLLEDGYDSSTIDVREESVHRRNEEIGLYDDEVPSSLWDDDE